VSIAFLTTCVSLSGPAAADVYSWGGLDTGHPDADGITFAEPHNWFEATVPAIHDTALFADVGSEWGPIIVSAPMTIRAVHVLETDAMLSAAGGSLFQIVNGISVAPGDFDRGRLTLEGDYYVGGPVILGEGPFAEGTLVLFDPSTRMTTPVIEVASVGVGSLQVAQGGELEANIDLGTGPGAHGWMAITGPGTRWQGHVAGTQRIGIAGNGTVEVTGGAMVSLGSGSTRTGVEPDARGTIILRDAGTTWSQGDAITLGHDGTGQLWLLDGAHITTGEIQLGQQPGSTGSALLDGAGSRWDTDERTRVGWEGRGTMQLRGGAHAALQRVEIGIGASGLGDIQVYGDGTTLTTSGRFTLTSGYVRVDSAGRLVTNGLARLDGPVSVVVAHPGTRWDTNDLQIGVEEIGADVFIEKGGALVTAGPVVIGHAGPGGLHLRDPGSSWTPTGSVRLARYGDATLRITDGATLETQPILIDPLDEAEVEITIGSGSSWHVLGDQVVRGDPDGMTTLTVENEALLTVDGTLSLEASATTVLETGAVLTADSLHVACYGDASLLHADPGCTVRMNAFELYCTSDLGAVGGTLELGYAGGRGEGFHDTRGNQLVVSDDLVVGLDAPARFVVTSHLCTVFDSLFVSRHADVAAHAVVSAGTLRVGDDAIAGTEGDGTIRVRQDGLLEVDGNLVLGGEPGSIGRLQLGPGPSRVDVGRTIRLGGPDSTTAGLGEWRCEATSTVIASDSMVVDATGAVDIGAGSIETPEVRVRGVLGGQGVLMADVLAAGRIDPGSLDEPGEVGTLTIDGELAFTDNGRLRIRIDDLEAHDRVDIGGTATLRGTLEVVAGPDYVPALGDVFVILETSEVLLGFDTLDLPPLPSGLVWLFQPEHPDGYALEIVEDPLEDPAPIRAPGFSPWGLILAALALAAIGGRMGMRAGPSARASRGGGG